MSGVDLAGQAKNTVGCRLQWARQTVRAQFIPHMNDEQILDLAGDSAKLGIDSPFGWPEGFVAAVVAHHRGRFTDPVPESAELRYRLTDRRVTGLIGRAPLSVSTDLIGVLALRCARLQRMWRERTGEAVDRRGSGVLAEVYPAAALAAWGLASTGYKRSEATIREAAGRLLDLLPWLELSPDDRLRLIGDHHTLDTLICALVARAVAIGRTAWPSEQERDVAGREGWIHVPVDSHPAVLLMGGRFGATPGRPEPDYRRGRRSGTGLPGTGPSGGP